MDLQTMLKRVKARSYKSKREFKDDLDLIWSNCLTYNAAPVRHFNHTRRVHRSSFRPGLQDHPLQQCAKRLQIKAERLLKNITDRKERSDPLIPSDLPGRTPSTIIIKPNGINGHSRSLSGTPIPLLPPAKSTIRIPPSALTKKKGSKDVSFPDSPAIIRTAEGMRLFKSADEELDVEGSNIENRLREFTLEDPDDFIDVDSEEETALIGDKRKLYVTIRASYAGPADTRLTGTVRQQKGRGKDLGGLLLPRNIGLTCGGRSCNATSSLAAATLRCNTLHPTRVAFLRLPMSGRCPQKTCRRRSLDANDGSRPQMRTLTLPTRRFSG